MENKKSLLHDLLRIIGSELIKQAEAGGNIGDQDFHIESIRKIENDGLAWNFEVATWSEQSENPREIEKMSFVQVIEVIARAACFSALSEAYNEVKKHEKPSGNMITSNQESPLQ
jgi:hypothetical protein